MSSKLCRNENDTDFNILLDVFTKITLKNILKYSIIGFNHSRQMSSESLASLSDGLLVQINKMLLFSFGAALFFFFVCFFFCLLLNHAPHTIIKRITIRGVRWPDLRSYMVAEIFGLIAKIGFSYLYGMLKKTVAIHRIWQQPPSRSRTARPPPGTWYRSLSWVWGYVGRWKVS